MWQEKLDLGKQWEIVPGSIPLVQTLTQKGEVIITVFVGDFPFLIHDIRYNYLGYVAYIKLKINDRFYGDWKIFNGNGNIYVTPALFLKDNTSFEVIVYSNINQPAELLIAIDGEKAREYAT